MIFSRNAEIGIDNTSLGKPIVAWRAAGSGDRIRSDSVAKARPTAAFLTARQADNDNIMNNNMYSIIKA